jgi:predicted ABC-type ATPase
MNLKHLYIIAGCNGAGKTTASYTILPEILQCYEFVNADEIAKGLSPFRPENVSFESGKIMLNRINQLFLENQNFAIETTLASRIYKNKISIAKANGYNVTLLFFWLKSVKLALERVKTRVEEGGHFIPDDVVIRRYKAGICNLFDIYMDIVDDLVIFDNSNQQIEIIAEKKLNTNLYILNDDKFNNLKSYYNGKI